MSDREAFEKVYPTPRCCIWDAVEQGYYLDWSQCPTTKEAALFVQHGSRWEAWQAALQSGEPVGEVFEVLCDGKIAYLNVLNGASLSHRQLVYTHPQPAVPEDITKDLNYLYWSAYHAGHHDTVEGCYRDVYAVDRFDYWEDRVSECIDDGDMPAAKALLSAGKETDK